MSAYARRRPAGATQSLVNLNEALAVWYRRNEEATAELAAQIGACRRAGATWGEVGARLGMTKQGARQHWSRYLGTDLTEPGTGSDPTGGSRAVR